MSEKEFDEFNTEVLANQLFEVLQKNSFLGNKVIDSALFSTILSLFLRVKHDPKWVKEQFSFMAKQYQKEFIRRGYDKEEESESM